MEDDRLPRCALRLPRLGRAAQRALSSSAYQHSRAQGLPPAATVTVMAKPVLLVTRKLPEAIEARAARDYDARLNPQDAPWATHGTEITRRAREAGAAGILGAPGDRFDAACINTLPPSVKI